MTGILKNLNVAFLPISIRHHLVDLKDTLPFSKKKHANQLILCYVKGSKMMK